MEIHDIDKVILKALDECCGGEYAIAAEKIAKNLMINMCEQDKDLVSRGKSASRIIGWIARKSISGRRSTVPLISVDQTPTLADLHKRRLAIWRKEKESAKTINRLF